MPQSDNADIKLFSPSLPKGGGSMKGIEENIAAPGSDGMARCNVPLPVTSGRYLTPEVSLSYVSGNGNGACGMGWTMGAMRIRRRTSNGIPRYTPEDQFLGPDGEVLVPECNEQGEIITRQTNTAQGIPLGETFTVTRYFPRIESAFHLLEYWEAQAGSATAPFWLLHAADGVLHCLGKTAQARIAAPDDSAKIAEWLVEESVSPFGEHIYYQYKEEDKQGVNLEHDNHQYGANRYLKSIRYGSKIAYPSLYVWKGEIPADGQWLYSVILDYGENDISADVLPLYTPQGEWLARLDCFSRYDYGFEVRTCRLCRQVLMFHAFAELGEEPALVWRMQLEYDETPAVSMLSAIRRLAYEADGAMQSIPPLEFDYSPFDIRETEEMADWQPFLPVPELEDGEHYQLVDLYGEGIPGLLYQDNDHWHYRSPVRGNTPEGITYDSWRPLPHIPAKSRNGMLMDLNGDGDLEWLLAEPGVAGRYSMNPDKTWSGFVPLQALPTEFFHPQAQLAHVTGSGFTDLVMIGPKSVRFYAGEEAGFKHACEVWQQAGIRLPVERVDKKELVAFSDILGSGQSHLVRIRHDGVTCWPNLGNGVFGAPLALPGFTATEREFNPEHVFLADLDGSGASDIIYASGDALLIYRNLSGNSFADPLRVPLPEGVRFDDLCRLLPGDIRGLGAASLVLHVPYMAPRSWKLDFFAAKPYLLQTVSNNLGASSSFLYRSSAQYWLDEKQAASSAVCGVPFPINVVAGIHTLDEISGRTRIQKYTYRNGVYDRTEKEFAGFGRIDTWEEERDSEGTLSVSTPPVLTRTWYHSGQKQDEERAVQQYWEGDSAACQLKPIRLTRFDAATAMDVPLDSPNRRQEYWLYRSLRGMPLRSEIFAGDVVNWPPYRVESFRYQVRLVQSADSECVTLPMQLEQLTYNYEQIASDPQCTQQIQQGFDKYGVSTQSVTIQYPRRPRSEDTPYPDTLPDTSWSSSYDLQQMLLRLTRQRQKVYHLAEPEGWRLNIPHQTRLDTFIYSADSVPAEGISAELLGGDGTLRSPALEQAYGGQSEIIYAGGGEPDLRALVHYTRSAVLDESCLQAYEGVLSDRQLNALLASSGYQRSARILGSGDEADIFVAEQGFTRYADEESFYRIRGQQASLLSGEQVLSWDDHFCAVISIEDALGNHIQVAYDYRFVEAIQITDANNNVNQVSLDALGRVVCSRTWGTEEGIETGFRPEAEFAPPETMEQALTLSSPLLVASCCVYDAHSWMGTITLAQLSALVPDSEKQWSFLIDNRLIMPDGTIRARGRDPWSLQRLLAPIVFKLLSDADRKPPHTVILAADRYPDDPSQQIQASIVFSDGFGRTIQTAKRADTRWAITERVDYDGTGAVIRSFQPLFLDDWQYVGDEAVSGSMYATIYDYDALARQIRMVNAKGYERRTAFYPWFTVNEDENDTMDSSLFASPPAR
ncbi:SpvB/TcaC N-terminal domain-containing protein [Paenibacillus thiaminolyticus]|uniref:Toxin n=1 Tax=Paenibacillus thiaminolyticus TaxID=49283 RepID=A0A3A3H1W6_PANTH|nr:SpvB/TcaC N-terminal domain-containing protein [Paenibacillus thiaminolyticus]RJG25196.1 toxin [Paenibacillus thiaminolyticus]